MNLTWALVGICVAISGLLITAYVLDRDTFIYRAVAKLAFPVTKQFLPNSKPCDLRSDDISLIDSLDGWQWMNDHLFEHKFTQNGLWVKATKESVWWQNKRGSFYYCQLDGDIDIEVEVKTRRSSDVTQYPNSNFQFGGIMMRDPRGDAHFSLENYIFNVVGFRGKKLQVETKSTVNGWSDVSGYDWDTGDARLKIIRNKHVFSLFAKNSPSQDWSLINKFERPDLPTSLQVGFIVYSFSHEKSQVDLEVEFSSMSVAVPNE